MDKEQLLRDLKERSEMNKSLQGEEYTYITYEFYRLMEILAINGVLTEEELEDLQ